VQEKRGAKAVRTKVRTRGKKEEERNQEEREEEEV